MIQIEMGKVVFGLEVFWKNWNENRIGIKIFYQNRNQRFFLLEMTIFTFV